MGGSNFRDLTGQYFGRLKVLKRAEDYIDKKGKHYVQWECECQCNDKTIVIVKRNNLTNNSTKSCGCLQKELVSERFSSKPNRYDLSGEYGIGYTSNTNMPFYFDLEDYNKIKDYVWYEHIVMNRYHRVEAYRKSLDKEKEESITLHYLITGKNQDHINRNPLDNRKSNLRPCSKLENAKNRSKQHNNTSGVTGVNYNKQKGKWIARIRIDKKETCVYSGDSFEDAVVARLKAEKKYYGEFASQQHLYEQYNI